VASVHPLDNVSYEQVGDLVSREEINRALQEEAALKENKVQFVNLAFEMAQHLKEIRDNRWYKLLGFDTFDSWVESPEIDIDRSTAYRYMKLLEVFVLSGAFKLEEVSDKSLSKLELLIPHIDMESSDWPKRKRKLLGYLDLTRKDLVITLNGNGSEKSDVNARAGFAVEQPKSAAQKAKNKGADESFDQAVPETEEGGVEAAAAIPNKKLGLSGWFELLPVPDPPDSGRFLDNVALNTQNVLIAGNKVFINIV